MILMIGAILGFISVAFGAYAEHGLKDVITAEEFRFLMTAIRYNQIHAVVLVAIGLSQLQSVKLANLPSLTFSGLGFILGTVVFCFSIYLSVWLGIKQLVIITPIGGMTLMASWLLLAYAGYCLKKSR